MPARGCAVVPCTVRLLAEKTNSTHLALLSAASGRLSIESSMAAIRDDHELCVGARTEALVISDHAWKPKLPLGTAPSPRSAHNGHVPAITLPES